MALAQALQQHEIGWQVEQEGVHALLGQNAAARLHDCLGTQSTELDTVFEFELNPVKHCEIHHYVRPASLRTFELNPMKFILSH